MIKLIIDYFRYRKAFQELNQLTDRELFDIGIARHEIKTVLNPKYSEPAKVLYAETEYALNKFLMKNQEQFEHDYKNKQLR